MAARAMLRSVVVVAQLLNLLNTLVYFVLAAVVVLCHTYLFDWQKEQFRSILIFSESIYENA